MSTILNTIAIILIVTGYKFHQTNLFWLAGLLALIALIFWVYSQIVDEMPEPMVKKSHSIPVLKQRPMNMHGLDETLRKHGIR